MPDEASIPPANTQAPPSEPVSALVSEPTPPPETAAPAPEPESLSQNETETGKPTPTENPAPAEVSEAVPESTPEPQAQPESSQPTSPAPQATQSVAPTSTIGELLVKARAKIQERRRKKLEKIMTKVTETGKISNNEVQKLLRVSDATATRYLDLLEKEGRLRQEGKTGKHVVYIKI